MNESHEVAEPNREDVFVQVRILVEKLENKLALDRFREQQIDKMHAELESHRQGLVDRLLLPLVTGIVRLHDSVSRLQTVLSNEPPDKLTPERLLKMVDNFREDLELVLDHGGIQLFTEPSEVLNPHRQLAQKMVPTPDETLVGRIVERLRPGFERDGRVIQKERVSVYVKANAAVSQ